MNEKLHGAIQKGDGQGLARRKGIDEAHRELNTAKRYLFSFVNIFCLLFQ